MTCFQDKNLPGKSIYDRIQKLFPINRSITGEGVRKSLQMIREEVPELEIKRVASGTRVLDWTVPREWNIRDAWIKTPDGRKLARFTENNLHVMGYSEPVSATMALEDLKKHIFTLPEHPDRIPYRVSYYRSGWAFCLSHNELLSLPSGDYEVFIDSEFSQGELNYGEVFLPGETSEEFLISCYICHPSMANDSLSGVGLAAELARVLSGRKNRLSYRILFIPETIGAIAWLAANRENVGKIRFGLVATCLGDPGAFTYKRSRIGNAPIDRIAEYVLKSAAMPHEIEDYSPTGSDERQYCSPGFNLPVGSLMRSRYNRFDEYHTSADNMDFITAGALDETFRAYLAITEIAETNRTCRNLQPFGEPNLGKRGLYENQRTLADFPALQTALLWVLNYSDGQHDLLDIATRSGIDYEVVRRAAEALSQQNLLETVACNDQ